MQHRGHECLALIPNYGKRENNTYTIDGIRVIQYAEPSVIDRRLNMGRRAPDGLSAFEALLREERPDIAHFQEVAGGNGMTIYHLKLAKSLGLKVMITFHLAGYTCRTGDLMFKRRTLCDGLIDEERCSSCFLQHKGYEHLSKPLSVASKILFRAGIDASATGSRIGTSLSFPFLIQSLRNALYEIADACDKIVVLTHWYQDILEKNGVDKKKISRITQGLPLQSSATPKPAPASKHLRLIFVGRISPLKGLHLLIEALKQIDSKQVSLHIFGATTDTRYERECRMDSVAMPNVKWMGKLKQAAVIPTMQEYHALCLPSTFSEMSPLVIQEAYAAGIPVIASATYGNLEQVQDGVNGLLFAFNDPDALAAAIKRLIDEPQLRQQLRDGIEPPKSFASVSAEYETLYTSLLTEKAK